MISRADTQQEILDATERLFKRYGPIKTTVADIARELGMSPANIYNFYASREDILEACGERRFAAKRGLILQLVGQAAPGWPQIAALFMTNFHLMCEDLANEKDIIQLQALMQKNRWRFASDHEDFMRATIAGILRDGTTGGRRHVDDPQAMASAIFDCMLTASDPVLIIKFKHRDHEAHVLAQLDLLERAIG